MKAPLFSVLLPSRDRHELLMRAIDSVRRQPFYDWEIIVSDNASSVPYEELIAGLHDSRIKYLRGESCVPVTANWNKALAEATGDYVVMLGDDDALAPGYFEVMFETIERYHQPEVVYCSAYHYCYPDVRQAERAGYFAIVLNSPLFIGKYECYRLARQEADALAKKALQFHHYFSFNSQHFVWKRSSMAALCKSGKFFKSPYPDFYSSIMTFLNAKEIIVNPRPQIIVGISPKSFGYYFVNQQDKAGNAFLGHGGADVPLDDPEVLPGSDHNTKWLLAAREVKRSMADSSPLAVGVKDYRRLQIVEALKKSIFGKDAKLRSALHKKLGLLERAFASMTEMAMRLVRPMPRRIHGAFFHFMDRFLDQHFPPIITKLPIGKHQTVLDAILWLEGKSGQNPESMNKTDLKLEQSASDQTSLMHVNPYLSPEQQKLTDRFHDLYYSLLNEGQGVATIRLSWLGHELFKCPMDLWLYQEIIVSSRPDVVIETGTYRGGSAHYLASMCDLVNHGKVITVDINAWSDKPRPQHKRLSYICGSSIDDSILAAVRKRVGASKNVLVILDSDHTQNHVLAELHIYQQFIPVGGLIVVEDTNVNGHPTYRDHGPGPWEAVDKFLEVNSDFISDRSFERFLLTMNPRGYLRRIAKKQGA